MSKHTPGPWDIRYCEIAGEIRVAGIYAGGKRIIETDSGYYPPSFHDAKLIATSPELLEAAKQLVDKVNFDHFKLIDQQGFEKCLAVLIHFIDKAESKP